MKKILIGVVVLLIALASGVGCTSDDRLITQGSDYQELVDIAKSVPLPSLLYSTVTGSRYVYSDIQVRFRYYGEHTGEKEYTITIWQLNRDSGTLYPWSTPVRDVKYDLVIGVPVSSGQLEYSNYIYTLEEIRSNVLGHNAEWMIVN